MFAELANASATEAHLGGVPPCPLEPRIRLRLLGRFGLQVDGRPVQLTRAPERVLAFVALARPGPVTRNQIAGELWPEANEQRAAASLRSAVWRLRKRCANVLSVSERDLALTDDVWIDIDHLDEVCAGGDVLGGPRTCALPTLMPGWYDDWLVHERERVRQDTLHTIEAMSAALIDRGRCGAAIDLAYRAIAAEPLRESPHRLVVLAHLTEGNRSEALRHLDAYSQLLQAELGVAPSEHIQVLADSICRNRPATTAGLALRQA